MLFVYSLLSFSSINFVLVSINLHTNKCISAIDKWRLIKTEMKTLEALNDRQSSERGVSKTNTFFNPKLF